MAIEISINEDTRKDFIDDIFLRHPELEKSIMQDFYRYKVTGDLPSYFGTDVAYTQPHAAIKAGLMHIHLKFPPDCFPENLPQSDRKCKVGDPEKDACLVYVQGDLYENKYSLLGILNPDAHGMARDKDIMSYLSRMAQKFRDEN
ncbi:type II toxin-antitoxin system YafO family toxin [Providencia rustigianii]|uniref:type II toxin-antitoxin system YafO family toxin n=1 Tax=Providencia rustigianii TaxID=158850 RepID=UPI00223F5AF7|nr:type II toxin-antitoxin system YafO family toxin [Providencia rustigianii]